MLIFFHPYFFLKLLVYTRYLSQRDVLSMQSLYEFKILSFVADIVSKLNQGG